MKKFKKAFTLIELLVVIAIIGILATVVIINVAGARQKAANAKVANDLAEASKIALQCLNEEGTVVKTTSISGGGPICNPITKVSQTWPTISGHATNGGDWQYAPLAQQFASGTGFTAIASTNGGSSPQLIITCVAHGCTKSSIPTGTTW